MSTFRVYKLTSPSGKHYIGYTGKTVDDRILTHIHDRQNLISKNKQLPRFYSALTKYPISAWKKETLHEFLTEDIATQLEINEIQNYNTQNIEFGYNMADGGDGDTGRNGEEWKRKQHSAFMKQHHVNNPNQASMSGKKNWENTKNNGKYEARCDQISERTPIGKEHWNHTGMWVVNHNEYDTLKNAVKSECLNEETILRRCNNPNDVVNRVSQINKNKQCNLIKGSTNKECGFYRT